MSAVNASSSRQSSFSVFFQKLKNIIQIVAVEGLATLRHTLPANISWLVKRYITKEITSFSTLEKTVSKVKLVANVYLHIAKIIPGQTYHPFLFIPGDFANPSTLLHMAEIAKDNSSNPIFSVHLPKSYDNDYFMDHKDLVLKVICKIKEFIVNRGGYFNGVFGVGHSKGALLLTHLFDEPNVNQVCSIAGRLRSFEEDTSCNQQLKGIISSIPTKVAQYPEKILHQIVPKQDWNAPQQAMILRDDPLYCHKVPGMHLSVLYEPATKTVFKALSANS